MKIPFRRFSKGLWLSPSVDEMPEGTLRRARGIHPLSDMTIRSRDGSVELYTLANIHTIGYFADSWVVGAGTAFYHKGAQLYTAFTETDIVADRITVAASTITVDNLDTDEEVSAHKDFGAAYFSADYDIRLRTKCTLSVAGKCGVFALTNNIDRLFGLMDNNYDHHALFWEEGDADSDTSLLIHCDGADESTSFTDKSSTGHTVTATGDAQVATAQKKFGTGSCLLDGTGDYLSLADHNDWHLGGGAPFTIDMQLRFGSLTRPIPDSYTKLLLPFDIGLDLDVSQSEHSIDVRAGAVLDSTAKFGDYSALFLNVYDALVIPASDDFFMGDGAFTVDFHLYFISVADDRGIFSQTQDEDNFVRLWWDRKEGGKLKFQIWNKGHNTVYLSAAWVPVISTWYHIAVIRGWNNDVDNWQMTVNGTTIGGDATETGSWPSLAAPFEIGRVVDPNIIEAPRYRPVIGRIDDFRISKGIARWTTNFAAPTTAHSYDRYFTIIDQSVSTSFLRIMYDALEKQIIFEVAVTGTTTVQLIMSWDPSLNTWYHLALIRGWGGDSNAFAFVVDGVSTSTIVDDSTWANMAAALLIGYCSTVTTNYVAFNGHIDEIRISNGTARWTSLFTSPTKPHSNYQLTLQETNNTVDTTDTTTAGLLDLNTNYYITLVRDDDAGTYGSLVATIYSDAKRSVVVDTLTVTLTEQQDFQYLFGMISYDGASGGNAWSGLIADLFIETPSQDLTSVKTGLNGDRLSLVKMPPTAGKPDYLFVAGGGALFKVSAAGAMTVWGIVAPTAAPSAAETDDGAGNLADGTYKYKVTYLNSTTGHRSDAYATAASVTIASGPSNVNLTSIPVSSDGQVDDRELWRTVVGGSVYFYLAAIGDNTTTTYKDTIVDVSLGSTELPDDNLIPYAWFDDCIGPYNASMFWITRDQAGQRGRVYYSPIGRPEAVQGFLEVTSDDDALQKLIRWGRSIGVMSKTRLYQIIGTNPYEVVEVAGVPGTDKPFTVMGTPHGLLYEADDGVRKLVGSVAVLISTAAIGRLFRGESPGGALTAFSGVVATYARDEYIISDLTQTLALNVFTDTWRDLGIGCKALYYADGVDIIAGAVGNKILDIEKESELVDDGFPIEFDIEPAHVRLDAEQAGLIQWIHVDADTNGVTLTVYLVLDNVETNIGTVTHINRDVTSFNVGKTGRVLGVRLYGNITEKVEIFGIDAELYVAGKEQG